jgi:hypothetical protein
MTITSLGRLSTNCQLLRPTVSWHIIAINAHIDPATARVGQIPDPFKRKIAGTRGVGFSVQGRFKNETVPIPSKFPTPP